MLCSTAIIPSVDAAHWFAVLQDDATVESLSAQDKYGDKHGWVHRNYSWLFEGDLFAGVASDAKLMCIRQTAEEFTKLLKKPSSFLRCPTCQSRHCDATCYIAVSTCTATTQATIHLR